MKKINVLVSESKDHIRKALVSILQEFNRVNKVWAAGNRTELFRELTLHEPDVLLLDLDMPEMDGPGIARNILNMYPEIKVIGNSFLGEEKYIPELIGIGAHGYLLKDCDAEELKNAIYSVIDQDFYLNEITLRIMRKRFTRGIRKQEAYIRKEFTQLEKEILKLICEEKSQEEIANTLRLSFSAVNKLYENLVSKIGVKGTIGLVKFAVEKGYL